VAVLWYNLHTMWWENVYYTPMKTYHMAHYKTAILKSNSDYTAKK